MFSVVFCVFNVGEDQHGSCLHLDIIMPTREVSGRVYVNNQKGKELLDLKG